MNWKDLFKKKEKTPKSFIREWRDALVFAIVVATLIRWGTVEAYVIPTPSMENSLLVGDYLFVSKLHYGPRTPRTPLQLPLMHQKIWGTEIPSYLDWIELPSYRIPGFSEVKRGEPVVFNAPSKELNEGKEYPIDIKTFYVKRCVGIAGDRIEIREKQLIVNGIEIKNPKAMKVSYLLTAKEEVKERNFMKLDIDPDDYYFLGRTETDQAIYKMFLTPAQADLLKKAPFVSSLGDDYTTHDGPEPDIFPDFKSDSWNGDNYGAIIVPKQGMTIQINDSTLGFYGETIQKYEHLEDVEIANHKLIIDGKEVSEYTFSQDYYFMMGDNRNNSLDSRYWGFVPWDHIVGKPLFVWFSLNSHAGLLEKIRWERLFTIIK
jgi:signal peptidase I